MRIAAEESPGLQVLFSDDCDGCRVAQVGAEAKPHSEGCRERIRQAMMNDDVGQQRLRAAEQQGSSAGEQPSVATRAEAAQEGADEAMNQAPAASSAREASVASSARNVRPRTAESGRMEDVVPSRKRGIGGDGSAGRPESHAS